jgi:DNA polymerase (family 10)
MPTSRDIDIMLVDDKPAALANYIAFVQHKIKDIWQYAHGPDKASFIIFYKKYVKLDIFRTPQKFKWAMMLYSTGSKEFNIRMRGIAKKKGLLLNQKGLYDAHTRLPDSSERDYFDHLDMPYLAPQER